MYLRYQRDRRFLIRPDVGLYSGDDRPDLSPFVVRRDHAEDLRTEKLAAVRAQFGPCTECRGACLPASVINKALVKKKYDLSVDELSKALELTSTEMPEEKEMLSEIIKFYNKTADEIMTPRLDMEDIDIKTSFRTVVDFIIRSG